MCLHGISEAEDRSQMVMMILRKEIGLHERTHIWRSLKTGPFD